MKAMGGKEVQVPNLTGGALPMACFKDLPDLLNGISL